MTSHAIIPPDVIYVHVARFIAWLYGYGGWTLKSGTSNTR
jgi:hypothetical protein